MTILTIRSDNPQAEIGLYTDQTQVAYIVWEAHRALAETIHTKVQELLVANQLRLQNLEAIVIYKGPGSFTGLRIGHAVANALASGLDIPIVGATGDDWIRDGIIALPQYSEQRSVSPEYGAAPHITQQKK